MKRILLIVLGLLLVGVGYTYWNYYNSFSDGYREGMLYKFSRKGNFFKTYEARKKTVIIKHTGLSAQGCLEVR